MKNKRLLFLCPSYPAIGGVEAVTSLLIDFFLEKEYDVFVLVSSVKETPGASLSKHIGLMTSLQGINNSKENLDFIDDFIQGNDIGCVFNQGVFSEAYLHASLHKDVVFINTLHCCPFWEIEKWKNTTLKNLIRAEKTYFSRIKAVVRFGLSRLKPDLSFPSIHSFYKRQIESGSFYVVLDPAYKKLLEKTLYKGVAQDKIVAIPNPLNLGVKGDFPKKKQVLYVGRLSAEQKRVDRLLRIWKRVQAEATDWELLIVGDGEHRTELEKMTQALKLERVRFAGFQNAAPFYESASILCLTSTYEGFPVVLPEAQAYGVVPISNDCVEAIRSIIDPGVNGLIIAPFDEKNYASELLALMKDDSRRLEMSSEARAKVSALSLEKIGQCWLDLLK